MNLIKLLQKIFKHSNNVNTIAPPEADNAPTLDQIKTAQHEAAHGIVWYLFKKYWTVNSLAVVREGLPDERMNGALHISPNFNGENETNLQRVNEIFAIAMAGIIGQNIEVIEQDDLLLLKVAKSQQINQFLDTSGCGGDFEIAEKYLSYLAGHFKTNEYSFIKYKLMDLISLFQNHSKVRYLHHLLTEALLEKGTLNSIEINNIFEENNFQEYIEYENLDINFFHNK